MPLCVITTSAKPSLIILLTVFLGSDIIYEHQDPDGANHIVERRCRLDVEVIINLFSAGPNIHITQLHPSWQIGHFRRHWRIKKSFGE